jgi:hypothetical protein
MAQVWHRIRELVEEVLPRPRHLSEQPSAGDRVLLLRGMDEKYGNPPRANYGFGDTAEQGVR